MKAVFRRLAAHLGNHAPQWILVGLNVFLFVALYGRFGDLIVDCSREATVPWRILRGDMIYRDFNYEYGPLAPYFLALCYRLLGVRLLTLNLAGLLISSSVSILIYALSRIFLNRFLSLGAGVLFIFVFAFQYSRIYNIFTYIFPYTFAASLGVLLLLATFYAGYRLLETGRPSWATRLGLFFALACLTKVEFILAVNLFVLLLLPLLSLKAWREGFFSRRLLGRWLWAFAWPAGAVLIPVCSYFAMRVDIASYIRTEISNMTSLTLPAARITMGIGSLSDLRYDLVMFGIVLTAYALLTIAFFGADRLAQLLEKRVRPGEIKYLFQCGIWLLTGILAWWAAARIGPFNEFTAMAAWIPIIGAGSLWVVWKGWRNGRMSGAAILVLCMSVVSFELLIRILFNARPVGYGTFLLVPGVLLLLFSVFTFLPAVLRRWGSMNRLYSWGILVFFSVTSQQDFSYSLKQYRDRRFPISTLRGTMRVHQDQYNAMVPMLEFFKDKHDYKLLVLPEGNMINFLLDSLPVTYSYAYVPAFLDTPEKEDRIIREIREKQIDYILVVTRWTTEFGFPIVGVDYAQRLKKVIDVEYKVVAQFGPPPFNQFGIFGMLLLERRARLP